MCEEKLNAKTLEFFSVSEKVRTAVLTKKGFTMDLVDITQQK